MSSKQGWAGGSNILCIANGEFREIPRYLSELVDINEVHLISDERPSYPVKGYHHFRKCTFGLFDDFDIFNTLPIDETLLEKLSVCESNVLKMMERYEFYHGLYGYNSRIDLYHKQVRYWYNYLLGNKIDCCVFLVNPHVIYDYIIYCICKIVGVKTILFYRTTVLIGGNVSIYRYEDMIQQVPMISKRYEFHLNNPGHTLLSNRMRSYYQLRDGSEGKTFTGLSKINLKKWFSLSAYISSFLYRFRYFVEWSSHASMFDVFTRLLVYIKHRFNPVFRYDDEPNLEEKYVYVSLHYQPECSTSPMGGHYVHQDLMVDLLARTLPDNVKIYIKAHVRGGLGSNLAQRLSLDDRSMLISPSFSSYSLIKHSLAVATVTGTAGLEAFINRKPVIMFGNYFYQHAPCVFQVSSEDDVRVAVKRIVDNEAVITDNMIDAFLKAVGELSFEGWVDNRYEHMCGISSDENIKNITKCIAENI